MSRLIFYFFISDPRKHPPMLLCVELIQFYSPSEFPEEMCRASSADPEGGQGVWTPLEITSYMGFYRE